MMPFSILGSQVHHHSVWQAKKKTAEGYSNTTANNQATNKPKYINIEKYPHRMLDDSFWTIFLRKEQNSK